MYRLVKNRPEGPLPESITFPDSLPAITAIKAAPDGFWVQRMGAVQDIDPFGLMKPGYSNLMGGPTWDIMDLEGKVTGQITLPPKFRLSRIPDGFAFGVQRDEMDVERVVRLRLTPPFPRD